MLDLSEKEGAMNTDLTSGTDTRKVPIILTKSKSIFSLRSKFMRFTSSLRKAGWVRCEERGSGSGWTAQNYPVNNSRKFLIYLQGITFDTPQESVFGSYRLPWGKNLERCGLSGMQQTPAIDF